jgi:hypothetical protein
MSIWKMPPKIKIYEALGALADQRVSLTGPTTAQVQSSAHDKTYYVEWSEDLYKMTSNDNASYWQGYIRYPMIAILLQLGKLSFHHDTANLLADVPWKSIHEKFKRDDNGAVHHILDRI